jgi:ankyrin repeat protein
LLDRGINVNQTDHDGNTALIWACEVNSAILVKMLLYEGANTDNANDSEDSTALIKAINISEGSNDIEIVQMLLKVNADFNYNKGFALIAAAVRGETVIATMLVDRGVCVY